MIERKAKRENDNFVIWIYRKHKCVSRRIIGKLHIITYLFHE